MGFLLYISRIPPWVGIETQNNEKDNVIKWVHVTLTNLIEGILLLLRSMEERVEGHMSPFPLSSFLILALPFVFSH